MGVRANLEHLGPSLVGQPVSVTARMVAHDGRRGRFEVVARHPGGPVVGRGEVTRAVVDRDRFLARAHGH